MSTEDAVQRAKAEIAEYERKIALVDQDRMRAEMQKMGLSRERDRLKAFVDLFPKFVLDAVPTPVPGQQVPAPSVPAPAAGAAVGGASVNGAGAVASDAPTAPVDQNKKKQARKAKGKKGKPGNGPKLQRKPDNLPTMTTMIMIALKEAAAHGGRGLGPREITNYIADKWWPGVKNSSVGPIVWRMAERKELRKFGDIYALPEGSEALGVPSAARH